MNKKPVLLRTIFTLIVVGVFVAAMFPLREKDFYETFLTLLQDPSDPLVKELVADAKAKQESRSSCDSWFSKKTFRALSESIFMLARMAWEGRGSEMATESNWPSSFMWTRRLWESESKSLFTFFRGGNDSKTSMMLL